MVDMQFYFINVREKKEGKKGGLDCKWTLFSFQPAQGKLIAVTNKNSKK